MAAGLAALRDHGRGAERDRAAGLVGRRHHRHQARAGRARRIGDRRRIVERRDRTRARGERALDQRGRRIGLRGLGRLVGQAELAPERPHDLEDALALAGRRRRRRELDVDPDRSVRRELARPRQVALERLAGHARGAEDAEAARARDRGHELGRARAVGHAREQDRHADAEQVAERRVQRSALTRCSIRPRG